MLEKKRLKGWVGALSQAGVVVCVMKHETKGLLATEDTLHSIRFGHFRKMYTHIWKKPAWNELSVCQSEVSLQ